MGADVWVQGAAFQFSTFMPTHLNRQADFVADEPAEHKN